jgi:hypothetical protein
MHVSSLALLCLHVVSGLDVNIGGILPNTDSGDGKRRLAAFLSAVDYVNDKQTVVQLVPYYGNANNAILSTVVANHLVADDIALVISAVPSFCTAAAMKITRENKVPVISSSSTVSSLAGDPLFFRTVYDNSKQALALEQLFSHLEADAIAVIHSGDEGDEFITEDWLLQSFPGGQDRVNVKFIRGSGATKSSFVGVLNSVKRAGTMVVLVWGAPKGLLEAAIDAQMTSADGYQWVFGDDFCQIDVELSNRVNTAFAGSLVLCVPSEENAPRPLLGEYLDRITRKANELGSNFTAADMHLARDGYITGVFDSVVVAHAALTAAVSTNADGEDEVSPAAILDKLRETNTPGSLLVQDYPMFFNSNGNRGGAYVWDVNRMSDAGMWEHVNTSLPSRLVGMQPPPTFLFFVGWACQRVFFRGGHVSGTSPQTPVCGLMPRIV